MPKRIQRKRTKGWRMPEGAIYVGRPTRFGNPFRIVRGADPVMAATALVAFGQYAEGRLERAPDWLAPLRGKDLACWCKEGAPCHADVLLKLANSGPTKGYEYITSKGEDLEAKKATDNG